MGKSFAKIMYKATKRKYTTNNPYLANFSEIIPEFLYISNIMLLQHKKFVFCAQVKYILSIVSLEVYNSIQAEIDDSIVVKHIPLEDMSEADISTYFNEAHEFIEEARVKHSKVLVHCEGGISRSPTIVIAYLMKYHNMPLKEALLHVSSRRPIISPNMGFMNELRKYEACLQQERLAAVARPDPPQQPLPQLPQLEPIQIQTLQTDRRSVAISSDLLLQRAQLQQLQQAQAQQQQKQHKKSSSH